MNNRFIYDDPNFTHRDADPLPKRITLRRPHQPVHSQVQGVTLHHEVPDGVHSHHPGGPTVDDALKAANISGDHVIKTHDGRVFGSGDDLYEELNDGDEVLVVPIEQPKVFQEWPQTYFNRDGAGLAVQSEEHVEEAAAKGFYPSQAEAIEVAGPQESDEGGDPLSDVSGFIGRPTRLQK